MDSLQDHKFNIRFVKTVKKYPVIYNTNLVEYTKTENRERAWIDIGEELNCDPRSLQRKWQNFRTILVRNLKRKQLGESKSKYYLYDHMKFVIPYLRKSYKPELLNRTVQKNICKKGEEAAEAEEVEEEEALEEFALDSSQSANENEMTEAVYMTDEEPINYHYESVDIASPNEIKLSTSIKEEFESEEDDVEVDVEVCKPSPEQNRWFNTDNGRSAKPTPAHIVSASTESAGSIKLANNAKRQFLLSLLPDLVDMSRPQMRQFKLRVLQLLDEVLG